jgi:cell fate regulator YaaT (PSP1 superfamily)
MNQESDSGGAVSAPPAANGNSSSKKIKIVGIRSRFDARPLKHVMGDLRLRVGDKVIVKTGEGDEEIGEISENPRVMDARFFSDELPEVLRHASEADENQADSLKGREAKSFEVCRNKIAEFKLPMKLVDVKYAFSSRKATFFFSADGRVDFRKLVKSLSERLSIRVEMRQIGVRDNARIKGGCGDCGRSLCCGTFLKAFDPISVRMAKDQNLSLNPSKLSGACGRLKCCLRFEHSHYQSVKKRLPACKKKVGGCNCSATVIKQDILREEITLALESGERMVVHADGLTRMASGQYTLKNPIGGE